MFNLRRHFLLDPKITFLNHGSFGAAPRPVFRTYQQWQRQLESQPVELTRAEFNLLEAFLSNPGFTLTRDDLLEKSMGYAYEGLGRALDTHIRNLRRKIEPDADNPTYIQTVYGVGYRITGDKP